MKEFESFTFNRDLCEKELAEFGQLLANKAQLDERQDILPFFRGRRQLSAFMGYFHPDVVSVDSIAYEFDLFGDFACDLAIGNRSKRAYCLVEFEAGALNSIFKKLGRATPAWSPRFEAGYSQVIDWFWRLADSANSLTFAQKFGGADADFIGLLVVGRDAGVRSNREEQRLRWRTGRVVVDSKRVHCLTYDQLYRELLGRLEVFKLIAESGIT